MDVAFSNTERNINTYEHILNFYLNYSLNNAFMPFITPKILRPLESTAALGSHLALLLIVLARR